MAGKGSEVGRTFEEIRAIIDKVELNEKLESIYPGLYIIGDGSGITHSLSHASASGVFIAREIAG